MSDSATGAHIAAGATGDSAFEPSWKEKNLKIAFLCSGGGGNLRFMAQAIRMGWIGDAEICAVLSDRECAANSFARSRGIDTEVIDFSATAQTAVLAKLRNIDADVIVTTVHKILVSEVVRAFSGKLVNLHYSLLPAFAAEIGDRPVRRALDYGAKFVGITVHLVDENVDTGWPIIQAVTAIQPGSTTQALMNTLFRSGCVGLLNAIASFLPDVQLGQEAARSSTMLDGQAVHFSPAVVIPATLDHFLGQIQS